MVIELNIRTKKNSREQIKDSVAKIKLLKAQQATMCRLRSQSLRKRLLKLNKNLNPRHLAILNEIKSNLGTFTKEALHSILLKSGTNIKDLMRHLGLNQKYSSWMDLYNKLGLKPTPKNKAYRIPHPAVRKRHILKPTYNLTERKRRALLSELALIVSKLELYINMDSFSSPKNPSKINSYHDALSLYQKCGGPEILMQNFDLFKSKDFAPYILKKLVKERPDLIIDNLDKILVQNYGFTIAEKITNYDNNLLIANLNKFVSHLPTIYVQNLLSKCSAKLILESWKQIIKLPIGKELIANKTSEARKIALTLIKNNSVPQEIKAVILISLFQNDPSFILKKISELKTHINLENFRTYLEKAIIKADTESISIFLHNNSSFVQKNQSLINLIKIHNPTVLSNKYKNLNANQLFEEFKKNPLFFIEYIFYSQDQKEKFKKHPKGKIFLDIIKSAEKSKLLGLAFNIIEGRLKIKDAEQLIKNPKKFIKAVADAANQNNYGKKLAQQTLKNLRIPKTKLTENQAYQIATWSKTTPENYAKLLKQVFSQTKNPPKLNNLETQESQQLIINCLKHYNLHTLLNLVSDKKTKLAILKFANKYYENSTYLANEQKVNYALISQNPSNITVLIESGFELNQLLRYALSTNEKIKKSALKALKNPSILQKTIKELLTAPHYQVTYIAKDIIAFYKVCNKNQKQTIQQGLKEIYETANAKMGIKYVIGIIASFISKSASIHQAWFKEIAKKYPINNSFESINTKELFDEKKENIQRAYFFNDSDGKLHFPIFMRACKRNGYQIIEKMNGLYYIFQKKVGDKTIKIYVNNPSQPDLANSEITKALKNNKSKISVVLHRGHEWHVKDTVRDMPKDAKIFYLGACNGVNYLNQTLAKNPNAHMFWTKGIGKGLINNHTILRMNEAILTRQSINWKDFWGKTKKRFLRSKYLAKYAKLYSGPTELPQTVDLLQIHLSRNYNKGFPNPAKKYNKKQYQQLTAFPKHKTPRLSTNRQQTEQQQKTETTKTQTTPTQTLQQNLFLKQLLRIPAYKKYYEELKKYQKIPRPDFDEQANHLAPSKDLILRTDYSPTFLPGLDKMCSRRASAFLAAYVGRKNLEKWGTIFANAWHLFHNMKKMERAAHKSGKLAKNQHYAQMPENGDLRRFLTIDRKNQEYLTTEATRNSEAYRKAFLKFLAAAEKATKKGPALIMYNYFVESFHTHKLVFQQSLNNKSIPNNEKTYGTHVEVCVGSNLTKLSFDRLEKKDSKTPLYKAIQEFFTKQIGSSDKQYSITERLKIFTSIPTYVETSKNGKSTKKRIYLKNGPQGYSFYYKNNQQVNYSPGMIFSFKDIKTSGYQNTKNTSLILTYLSGIKTTPLHIIELPQAKWPQQKPQGRFHGDIIMYRTLPTNITSSKKAFATLLEDYYNNWKKARFSVKDDKSFIDTKSKKGKSQITKDLPYYLAALRDMGISPDKIIPGKPIPIFDLKKVKQKIRRIVVAKFGQKALYNPCGYYELLRKRPMFTSAGLQKQISVQQELLKKYQKHPKTFSKQIEVTQKRIEALKNSDFYLVEPGKTPWDLIGNKFNTYLKKYSRTAFNTEEIIFILKQISQINHTVKFGFFGETRRWDLGDVLTIPKKAYDQLVKMVMIRRRLKGRTINKKASEPSIPKIENAIVENNTLEQINRDTANIIIRVPLYTKSWWKLLKPIFLHPKYGIRIPNSTSKQPSFGLPPHEVKLILKSFNLLKRKIVSGKQIFLDREKIEDIVRRIKAKRIEYRIPSSFTTKKGVEVKYSQTEIGAINYATDFLGRPDLKPLLAGLLWREKKKKQYAGLGIRSTLKKAAALIGLNKSFGDYQMRPIETDFKSYPWLDSEIQKAIFRHSKKRVTITKKSRMELYKKALSVSPKFCALIAAAKIMKYQRRVNTLLQLFKIESGTETPEHMMLTTDCYNRSPRHIKWALMQHIAAAILKKDAPPIVGYISKESARKKIMLRMRKSWEKIADILVKKKMITSQEKENALSLLEVSFTTKYIQVPSSPLHQTAPRQVSYQTTGIQDFKITDFVKSKLYLAAIKYLQKSAPPQTSKNSSKDKTDNSSPLELADDTTKSLPLSQLMSQQKGYRRGKQAYAHLYSFGAFFAHNQLNQILKHSHATRTKIAKK